METFRGPLWPLVERKALILLDLRRKFAWFEKKRSLNHLNTQDALRCQIWRKIPFFIMVDFKAFPAMQHKNERLKWILDEKTIQIFAKFCRRRRFDFVETSPRTSKSHYFFPKF